MSSFNRRRQERRRTGQYHGRAAGYAGGVVRYSAALALLFCLPALPQSLLHIRVLEGEGLVNAPGAKVHAGLIVQVTDETGRPVEGAAVSFRMPEEGPGGSFARGMKTEIATTTPDGRAAAYGLECNRLTGPFQIRVTAVKQQVRAGMIVSQYISEKASGARTGKSLKTARSGRKWVILGAIAGGAAAGVALGMPRGSAKASTPAAAAAPPPQIGQPTITIGKP